MHTVEALREFKLALATALLQKTTWGRNELKEVIDKEYQIILEKLVEMR